MTPLMKALASDRRFGFKRGRWYYNASDPDKAFSLRAHVAMDIEAEQNISTSQELVDYILRFRRSCV